MTILVTTLYCYLVQIHIPIYLIFHCQLVERVGKVKLELQLELLVIP